MLQVVTVGRVTRPVTQVAVVAVNSASRYGTGFPVAELTGIASRRLPSAMTIKKLSIMICVVDSVRFFFMIDPLIAVRYSQFCPKKAKGNQRPLQSAGSQNILLLFYRVFGSVSRPKDDPLVCASVR